MAVRHSAGIDPTPPARDASSAGIALAPGFMRRSKDDWRWLCYRPAKSSATDGPAENWLVSGAWQCFQGNFIHHAKGAERSAHQL